MFDYKWLGLPGNLLEQQDGILRLKGGLWYDQDGVSNLKTCNYLCNQYFSDGKIVMDVEFDDISDDSSCEILFNYSNENNVLNLISVGINKSKNFLFELVSYRNNQWDFHQFEGDPNILKPHTIYNLELEYIGNHVNFKINGIEVINYRLPFSNLKTQVGIRTRSKEDILIHNYEVNSIKPKAFIIMQFSEQFNELYNEVIKPLCKEFEIDPIRADDIHNNGMIINDIVESINESKVIIADITSHNPNVYYEVGYSHALSKATILLAEENYKLPFDVNPYRVIFYKNSISGKSKLEESLRKHLSTII